MNEEVRRCHCRDCGHWFTEDWKPIRLQAISQETMNLILTLICYGMGMNEMAELMLTVQGHEEVERATLFRALYKVTRFLSAFEQIYMRLCGGFPAETLAVFAVERRLAGGGKVDLICSADFDSTFWITAIPEAATCFETAWKLKNLLSGEPKKIICSDLIMNPEFMREAYPNSEFEIASQIPTAEKICFNRLVSLTRALSKSAPKEHLIPFHHTPRGISDNKQSLP